MNFSIVRSGVCLSPIEIIHDMYTSVLRANKLIQKLYYASILSSVEADKAKQEYQAFLNSIVVTRKQKFLSFDKDVNHLDSFLVSYMTDDAKYVNLWKVSIIILVLSHSQTDLERGFNVNSELLKK